MRAETDEDRDLPDYDPEVRHEINLTLQATLPGEWGELALCPGPYGCPPWGHEHSGVTQGGEEMFCSGCRIIRIYRPR